MTDINNENMPSGWECRMDTRTGKPYYINHQTKTTSWKDPRTEMNKQAASQLQPQSSHSQASAKPFQSNTSEYIPLKDMRNLSRGSPLTVRSSKIQESTLININDSDEAVAKISAMFPTVTETHIRVLMKNCRYMKSLFPKAEEGMLLDMLANNDNNIQKTSDVLKQMGYEKRDSLKASQQKQEVKLSEEKRREEEKIIKPPVVPPRRKTSEEKMQARNQIKNTNKEVEEHLIDFALESVDFDVEKALHLLKSMAPADTTKIESEVKEIVFTVEEKTTPETDGGNVISIPVSQSRQSIKSLLKGEKTDLPNAYTRIIEDDKYVQDYKSKLLSSTSGPNANLRNGPNGKLLLEEYVKWQGPQKGLARGPNPEFRKGPNRGIVKGSIFNQMKSLGEESRGK